MGFSNIGIVSDTHNDPNAIQEALRKFEDYDVDRIIHCGDVTDPAFVSYFRGWKVDFVLGNCDGRNREELIEAIEEIGCVCHGHSATLEWAGHKIFVTHGHDKTLLDDAIFSGEYDFVCSGHTHIFEEYEYQNTRVLNPGALQSFGSYCIVSESLDVDKFDVE